MNRKWIAIAVSLAVGGYWINQKFFKKADSKDKSSFTKVDGTSYWTCPMHPQIHMDHAGECPICHMKLVKVAEQSQTQEVQSASGDKRSSIFANSSQLNLLGIQKQEVEKMTLIAKIPVSGRVLSTASVAFQVYEKDLRYIHPGLGFKGEGSIYSEDEISGVISSVDSIVDPTSRTVRVLGAITKGPKRLLSETSFRGEIQIELKDRIAIPESSVLHTGKGDLVYIFEGENKLIPKTIKVGLKSETFFEVLDGLKEGDFISSGPNFLLDSEAKIRGAND